MDNLEHIYGMAVHILWAWIALRALKVAQGKNVIVRKKGLDVEVIEQGPDNID